MKVRKRKVDPSVREHGTHFVYGRWHDTRCDGTCMREDTGACEAFIDGIEHATKRAADYLRERDAEIEKSDLAWAAALLEEGKHLA